MTADELEVLLEARAIGVEKLRKEAPKAFAIASGALEGAIAEVLLERLGKTVASRIAIDAGAVLEGSEGLDAQALKALEDAKLKPKAYQAAKDAAAELGPSAGLVLAEQPVGAQPFLRDAFARDADGRLAEASGLDPAIHKKIGQPLETLRGAELGALVEQGVVDRTSALALGLTLTVHALLDRDPVRTAHVLAALRARQITSPHALATLSLRDWTALLGDAKQAARALAEVERALPSSCLQARLSACARALLASPALPEALTEIEKQPFWLQHEGGGEPLRALRRIVRAHPGLGLEAIVQSDAAHGARVVELGERLALFARVRDALPELRTVSLTRPPSEWDFAEWGHASPEEQQAVAEALRAHQRVLAVTSHPGHAEALLTAGLPSAASIELTPVPLLAERTGLAIELARPLAEAARRTMGRAGQQALRLRELLGDRLAPRLRFDPAVIGEAFRDLPDMATLFGAGCRCEPCRSVLSPGAYLADLMCVIESHVIARFFTPATDRSPGHPHALHPRTRRPDLWELPLSCAHTNDEVPTLAIVLDVLERYVRELHGARDVYTGVLARGARSLRQPFERAQVEIDATLSKLGSTRLAVAEALGGDRDRAALGMSATQATLVFGPAASTRDVEARFGVSLGSPVPMGTLMRATRLDRDALAQVLEARFVRGTDAPSIVRADEERAEEVRGLTAGLLDRLHRFERLRAHTGWPARELDAVLSTTGLSLEAIGAVRRTQLRFGIGPLDGCAIATALPESIVAILFAGVRVDRPFVHPAHGGADAATAGALRARCGTTENELVLWLERLARERGGRVEGGVVLDREALGWLYRHALDPGGLIDLRLELHLRAS